MDIWYTKPSASGTYTRQKSPSTYSGECEDLDANSYRSKATGNLIDNVISTKWSKLKYSYNCLTATEFYNLINEIKPNPIYAKCLHPQFPGGYIEAEFRCSKYSWDILETGEYKLSFNLVQKKKVSGQ